MKKTIYETTISVHGNEVYIEQPSDYMLESERIFLNVDQIDIIIEWLKAAKKEIESITNE